MNQRAYRDESDIHLLREFNSRAIKETGGCGYLHPGDITHHLFSGNKLYDFAEIATIWEDGNGVAAWTLVGPQHRGFDLQVRPDMRGGDFERHTIRYAEDRTRELMARHGVEGDRIEAGACRCDRDRSRLLLELGWTAGVPAEYVLNRRALLDIPEPSMPDGYVIRSVRGVEEAGAVADLHLAIFTRSGWTEGLYRRYMRAPGYSADREYVVQAPDGALAGFTVTWYDRENRTGLFEPVGTHRDHRRKGLGRALLCAAMHRMVGDGLLHALVQNEGGNEASRALYAACDFTPWQFEDSYTKPV